MQLFEFIDNLFTKQKPITSEDDFRETYMALKFLSLYPGTFATAVKANQLAAEIPSWAINLFLFHTIEKQKAHRFEYPKKNTKEIWPKSAIQKVAQQNCCSPLHAEQILSIMAKQKGFSLEIIGIETKRAKDESK